MIGITTRREQSVPNNVQGIGVTYNETQPKKEGHHLAKRNYYGERGGSPTIKTRSYQVIILFIGIITA